MLRELVPVLIFEDSDACRRFRVNRGKRVANPKSRVHRGFTVALMISLMRKLVKVSFATVHRAPRWLWSLMLGKWFLESLGSRSWSVLMFASICSVLGYMLVEIMVDFRVDGR